MNGDGQDSVRVSQAALLRAERDLDWWHNCRESKLGLRAAGYEPAIGGGRDGLDIEGNTGEVFHFEAAVIRLFDGSRKEAVRRHRKVARALCGMTARERELAAALYTARNVPEHLDVIFALPTGARDSGGSGSLNLVGLIPHTGPFQAAWQAISRERRIEFAHDVAEREEGGWKVFGVISKLRQHESVTKGPIEWLDWVCRPRVEKGRVINSRLPTWLVEARSEARRIRGEILRAYAIAAMEF